MQYKWEFDMPILRYQCTHCGKEFAKIFSRQEDAPRKCPVCHAENPVELGPAFQYDHQMIQRALCTSCDSCESDGASCTVPASS